MTVRPTAYRRQTIHSGLPRSKVMKVGDRVGYTAKFLKSVGADWEIASLRGTVERRLKVGTNELITVRWDEGSVQNVFASNLAVVGSTAFCD